MKIWKLRFDSDRYASLKPVPLCTIDEVRSFDGREKINTWKTRKVIREDSKGSLPIGDAPSCFIPVFSKRALNVLRSIIKDSIEELALEFNEGEYTAINVTKVLNVIDYEKSRYRTFSDGKKVMAFEKYAFKENIEIAGSNIFKIVDEPISSIFVSDTFKEMVERENLRGFDFTLVWNSDENADKEVKSVDMNEETEFAYVEDIGEDVMKEIRAMSNGAIEYFNIKKVKDITGIVVEIDRIVEKILRKGKYPKQYSCLEDVAVALGCLFGFAIVKKYGWDWKAVGQSKEDATFCVVSPDNKLVHPCMKYIYRILNQKKDDYHDNTCLLFFNMLGVTAEIKQKNGMTVVW